MTLQEKITIGERFAAKIRWRLEHYGAADFSDAEVARCMNANRKGMPPNIVEIAQAMVTYRLSTHGHRKRSARRCSPAGPETCAP